MTATSHRNGELDEPDLLGPGGLTRPTAGSSLLDPMTSQIHKFTNSHNDVSHTAPSRGALFAIIACARLRSPPRSTGTMKQADRSTHRSTKRKDANQPAPTHPRRLEEKREEKRGEREEGREKGRVREEKRERRRGRNEAEGERERNTQNTTKNKNGESGLRSRYLPHSRHRC